MGKVVITDEMVERGYSAALRARTGSLRGDLTVALEAALNPPAEPEYTITEDQIGAGASVIGEYCEYFPPTDQLVLARETSVIAKAVYLTMRRLEKPAPDQTAGCDVEVLKAALAHEKLNHAVTMENTRSQRESELTKLLAAADRELARKNFEFQPTPSNLFHMHSRKTDGAPK